MGEHDLLQALLQGRNLRRLRHRAWIVRHGGTAECSCTLACPWHYFRPRRNHLPCQHLLTEKRRLMNLRKAPEELWASHRAWWVTGQQRLLPAAGYAGESQDGPTSSPCAKASATAAELSGGGPAGSWRRGGLEGTTSGARPAASGRSTAPAESTHDLVHLCTFVHGFAMNAGCIFCKLCSLQWC